MEYSTNDSDPNHSPQNDYEKIRQSFIDDVKSIISVNPEAEENCFANNDRNIKLSNIFDENDEVKKEFEGWVDNHVQNIDEANKLIQ